MKTWVLTAAFTAAGVGYAIRAIRAGRANGEVMHALMCLGMVAMAWLTPATHLGGHGALGALCEALAVVFFLGAVWAAVTRAPASCLMAFGTALVFTPVD